MSICWRNYRNYVCNNHLNLRNKQLSPEETSEILYCLQHQEELPFSIRVVTVDLTGSSIKREELPVVIPGPFDEPIQFC